MYYKKDPITGCTVLTMAGMMAHDAKINGTTEAEEWNKYYEEMAKADAEDREITAKYHKEKALEILLKEVQEYNKEDIYNPDNLPIPEKILLFIDSYSHGNFKGSTSEFSAEVRCTNGKNYLFEYGSSYYAGSFYEPPDGETNVTATRIWLPYWFHNTFCIIYGWAWKKCNPYIRRFTQTSFARYFRAKYMKFNAWKNKLRYRYKIIGRILMKKSYINGKIRTWIYDFRYNMNVKRMKKD